MSIYVDKAPGLPSWHTAMPWKFHGVFHLENSNPIRLVGIIEETIWNRNFDLKMTIPEFQEKPISPIQKVEKIRGYIHYNPRS